MRTAQALLPQRYPRFSTLGDTGGIRAAVLPPRPGVDVGRRFSLDVFALSDTVAGIVVCDVMGHGVRASLVTVMLRTLVEELLPVAADPGEFLAGINRGLLAILKHSHQPMFATAFYLVADAAAGQLRYAGAGPSQSLARAAPGRHRGSVGHAGDGGRERALGLFEDSQYAAAQCALAPDDVIVLYTDGLFEVEGRDGSQYGQERLLAAVQGRIALPPARLFDELVAEVQQFAVRQDFLDDVCLVGLEVARVGLNQ